MISGLSLRDLSRRKPGSMTAISESAVAVGGARDRARWVMLIVLLCGQFMALLDVTVVNVAMPTIGQSLHASGAELQLVIAGYTVSYAMLLITGARLGDLVGRRRMFLYGVGGFTLASLTCGLAPDIGVLIAARFAAGAAAAAMMPQIMTVIQLRFGRTERARCQPATCRSAAGRVLRPRLCCNPIRTLRLTGCTRMSGTAGRGR